MFRIAFSAAIAAGLFVSASASRAAVISFETFSHGDRFTNGQTYNFDRFNARIETNNNRGPNQAQIYDSRISNGRDSDLQSPRNVFDNSVYQGGDLMIIAENSNGPADDDADGGTITFFFEKLVRFSGITLIDGEEGQNEISVLARGRDNTLDFVLEDTFTGDDLWRSYVFDSVVTNEITVQFGGSGAFDQIVIGEVPLPASALLFATAIGGFILVRRQRIIAQLGRPAEH
ncbi:MAG: VPLPA-CTERM sorting domain-containing protein [Pseudomonadota bacterium]